jgi:hypothetical protein
MAERKLKEIYIFYSSSCNYRFISVLLCFYVTFSCDYHFQAKKFFLHLPENGIHGQDLVMLCNAGFLDFYELVIWNFYWAFKVFKWPILNAYHFTQFIPYCPSQSDSV